MYVTWDVLYKTVFCRFGAEVPLCFLYICKLYRCIVSQKKEYTGCTVLTAVLYYTVELQYTF